MKKFIVTLLTVALVFGSVSAASAKDHKYGRPHAGGGMHDVGFGGSIFKAYRFAEELGLSNAQLEKLEAIKDSGKREKFKLRNEIKLATWEIEDELKNDKPDRGKINAAAEKISDAQKKLMMMKIDHMLAVKKILTKRQFKDLSRMMKHKKDKMKKKSFWKKDKDRKKK